MDSTKTDGFHHSLFLSSSILGSFILINQGRLPWAAMSDGDLTHLKARPQDRDYDIVGVGKVIDGSSPDGLDRIGVYRLDATSFTRLIIYP